MQNGVNGVTSQKKQLYLWILSKFPLPPPNQKRQFKRHSKLLIIQNSSQIKAEDVLCGSCMQPKKQFKVQIIGILEEIDSVY